MRARGRSERALFSWTSRSIGVANGRHAGAYRSEGRGGRYRVIRCVRKRQNPGRASRAGGCSCATGWASSWSVVARALTGGMTRLLLPGCFPSVMEAASGAACQYAGTGGMDAGQGSIGVRASQRKYPFPEHKRKTIIFMISRKKCHS